MLQDNAGVLVKALRCVKFLSMNAMTLDPLQRAGYIPKLVNYLNMKSGSSVVEIHNQVLNALFNLCKINHTRQEQAALHGIIPPLKAIVAENRCVCGRRFKDRC